MPPFPPVALGILSLTTAQDVTGQQLAASIRRDATFTAELLRVANSALFGFSRRVGSVPHAVVLLGLDRVKAMAMFVALRASLRSALSISALKRVWVHTVATAVITERLALENRVPPEEAYTAGLLHNLGALGLMCAYPADYAFLLETPLGGPNSLLETERSLFGIDHCDAGRTLALEWKLPAEIAAVAKTHHAEPVRGDTSIPNLVRVALAIARCIGYADAPDPEPPPEYGALLKTVRIAGPGTADDLRHVVESQLAFVPFGE